MSHLFDVLRSDDLGDRELKEVGEEHVATRLARHLTQPLKQPHRLTQRRLQVLLGARKLEHLCHDMSRQPRVSQSSPNNQLQARGKGTCSCTGSL